MGVGEVGGDWGGGGLGMGSEGAESGRTDIN